MDPSTELARRYVAVWNEPDPRLRREAVRQLWWPDGEHFVRDLAACGHDALEERVRGSHEKNVRGRGFRFELAGPVQALHDAVMFHWKMVRPADPATIEALGLQLLRVREGRIATDYQFILPMTSGVMAATAPSA